MAQSDAYRVLQVDREADIDVLRAAYRALARRYHPDGTAPDHARMTAVNAAYAQVRTPELRAAYDRRHLRLQAVGPAGAPPGFEGAIARAAERNGRDGPSSVLSFGRYAGWSIAQLARHDPGYLRWLSRHSAGLRFRTEIQQHLGHEPDLQRRANATA